MITSKDLCEQYGMLIWPEAQILKKCVSMLPKNPIIVNIGAGFGTSSAAILEERPDAFIFSVDKKPAVDEHIGILACGMDLTRCVRLLGKSWEVGRYFPYSVNMVFVDGDHGTKAVEQDIMTWLSKVIPGGIMAFHDYKHPNVPELTEIVNRFMSTYKVIAEHRYMIAYKISQ